MAATGLLALLLGACRPLPAPAPEAEGRAPTPEWPAFDYTEAAAAGRAVYRLDPQRSRIDVVTRSDGPLARFGHDHAVVVASPEGYLMLEDRPLAPAPERADLRFDVRSLKVDPTDARERYGLGSEMTEADIRGTRQNLMDTVLNAAGAPYVTLSLSDFRSDRESASALVAISVQGQRYSQRQPFQLQIDETQLTVEGSFVLRHSDLGLTPYSAFGGSLRVADPMDVHFSLTGVAY